eukprot:scaffold62402_cov42-Cyclotella_meneghiniana.AAC.3
MMFGCETWRGGWFGLIWGERRLIWAKKGARNSIARLAPTNRITSRSPRDPGSWEQLLMGL